MTRAWLGVLVFVVACTGADDGASDDANPSGMGDGKADEPTPPTTITVRLTDRTSGVSNFIAAYQEGTKPWQAAPAPAGDTYTFVVTAPTWSFAWACANKVGEEWHADAHVMSYATSEMKSLVVPEGCPHAIKTIKVGGTVTNAPIGPRYSVYWGERSGGTLQNGTNTFTFELQRQPGTHDLYAATHQFVEAAGSAVTKLAVTRGVVATTNISNATVDFATALPTTPPLPVTIDASSSERTTALTYLYDASGTQIDLDNTWLGPPHTTRGIAASQLSPGSVYAQTAAAHLCPASAIRGQYCDQRKVERWTSSISAHQVTLPAPLGPVTATVSGASLTASWPAYPGATGYTWIAYQGYDPYPFWTGTVGRELAGNAPRFTIPDLSALAGWELYVLKPASGTSVINGVVSAHVSSLGIGDFPPVTPAPAGTNRVTVDSRVFVEHF
jgi:hypothetical protein